MQYGLIILSIGGLIAFIFFTNFLDNLQKFLKQIFSKFKKKKVKSYLPKDYGKKKVKQKKQLGIWWADWANSYEKPLSATLIVTVSYIVGIYVFDKIFQISGLNENDNAVTIGIILYCIPMYYLFKLWAGIIQYHCPKCKRIHAGEIYSSAHIGSKQRARKYRVQDNRTLKYRDHRGISQKSNYTIERDETGVEQVDTYHNKAKCLLCNHKWEYNSSTSTRVA